MFTMKTASTEKSGLEKAIDELLDEMANELGTSDEYSKMADQLVKLYKLKEVDSTQRVSKDTIALIAGNLAGIAMIVGHERAAVVTSKAMTFVKLALK